jgi:transposase
LIDLDRHRIIDLLPDRLAETAAAWMRQHPDIDLVSRDRGGDYAAAARTGAPQAIQVADRFHVMSNLTEAVKAALTRCWAEHQRPRQHTSPADRASTDDATTLPEGQSMRFRRSRTEARAHQTRQAVRDAEYAQMLALRAQGMSFKAIAKQMGKGGTTVWSWLTQGSTPTGTHQRQRSSQLDAYIPYVLERWQEGYHHGLQLWREITARGYGGSAHMLYAFLATLRHPTEVQQAGRPAETHLRLSLTAREALWLVVRDPVDLAQDEQETLTTLRQAIPLVEAIYPLVQEFRQLLHQRAGDRLDHWLEQARASCIQDLRRFAEGIEKDKAAVVAGFTVQESNGPTEGHITKLKLVKRTMYGRAGFSLLRQRLLHAL